MEGQGDPHQATRVGEMLRACRLRARLDLADVAHGVNIRPIYLEAIEDGRFEALPGPVYAQGFVRAYAEYLGLDADVVAKRHRAEIAGRSAATPLHFPLAETEANTPRGGVLLLGALIAVTAYGAWYVMSSNRIEVADLVAPLPARLERMLGSESTPPPAESVAPAGSATPAALPPSISAPSGAAGLPATPPHRIVPPSADMPLAAGPAPTAKVLAIAATPPMPASAPTVSASSAGSAGGGQAQAAEPPDGGLGAAATFGGRIVLRAKADSWVEVRDPETRSVLTARLLRAGDVYRVPERSGLTLLTGNAGGLVVLVDGESAPSLGRDGAVRRGIPLDAELLRRGLETATTQ